MLMFNRWLVKAESSGWLFVTTCRGRRRHIVSASLQAAQLARTWKRVKAIKKTQRNVTAHENTAVMVTVSRAGLLPRLRYVCLSGWWLTSKQNQLRFLVTAMCYLTYCHLRVNVLCKLINTMVFGSVVLYSRKCRMLKLAALITFAG